MSDTTTGAPLIPIFVKGLIPLQMADETEEEREARQFAYRQELLKTVGFHGSGYHDPMLILEAYQRLRNSQIPA